MSRVILSCGAAVDTLLGGISLLSGSESCWWISLVLTGLTVASPIVFFLATTIVDAFDQPEVLPPPS